MTYIKRFDMNGCRFYTFSFLSCIQNSLFCLEYTITLMIKRYNTYFIIHLIAYERVIVRWLWLLLHLCSCKAKYTYSCITYLFCHQMLYMLLLKTSKLNHCRKGIIPIHFLIQQSVSIFRNLICSEHSSNY